MYWWWDEYIEPQHLWSQFKGISAYLSGERLGGLTPGRLAASGGATAMALTAPTRALIWVRADGYSQDEAKRHYTDAVTDAMRNKTPLEYAYKPPAVANASITVTGLRPGTYAGDWLSTADGTPVQHTSVTIGANGSGVMSVPAFVRDIALKLSRQPGV